MATAGEVEQRVQELERSLLEERRKNESLSQKLSELQCSSEAARVSSGTQNSDLPAELQQLSLEKVRLAAERAENAFEAEQEYIMHKLRKQMAILEHDKKQLSLERQQLKRTVQSLQGSVERLTQDKVDLEASLEMEEEAFINNLVRQLSGFMQNYQAMDRAMHEHGIRITPMAAAQTPPRVRLARASTVSQEGASQEALSAAVSDASPHAPARQSAPTASTPSAASVPAGRRPAPGARAPVPGMARSLGGSPGATLHATRERLEALARTQRADDRRGRHAPRGGGGAGGGGAGRGAGAHVMMSEDSLSSMGSIMSAMSRDPSMSRESVTSAHALGASCPISQASDGPRSHK
eukprot:jgi/Ulvmu1/1920/UM012_0080.1